MRTPPDFLMELLSHHGIKDPMNGQLTQWANENFMRQIEMAYNDGINQYILHKYDQEKYEAPNFTTWYAKWTEKTPAS